jgi:stearoyl-CoA desaturase (delta-9 desaturase)
MTTLNDTALPAPPGQRQVTRRTPLPDLERDKNTYLDRFLIGLFVVAPPLAVAAAAPLLWGWGLGWHDIVIAAVFYVIAGMGISMGFHRHFTHSSFKAAGPLRVALAIAGSLAIEGPVLVWVADHRRHHKYSDREGDPHSPWRFGNDWKALSKGLAYAHVGWLFDGNRTSQQKFCPDLLADRAIRRVSRAFPIWAVISLLGPALIGGLWSMSWTGALTAFFWASLVRVMLLHHVTWSINSVCHTFGNEDFEVRDKSRNVAWLAILSFGESWHNLHHADPTCARHGALRGQIDISARVISWAERLGWAWDVRWPDAQRLSPKMTGLRPVSLGTPQAPRPGKSMTNGNATAMMDE